MRGKIAKEAATLNLKVRDASIERIKDTQYFKLGVVAMGQPIPEEFVVLMSGANGKIHIEALVQNLNSKSGQLYQMAALVPDDKQWEILVDFVQRSGLTNKQRLNWVWREARKQGIKLDLKKEVATPEKKK